MLAALTLSVAVLAACSPGASGDQADAGRSIVVEDATVDWPANPEVAAVHLRIRNLESSEDALVGVSSPIARSAMVHQTEIDAEGRAVMAMSEQIPIAARSTVTFEPSGLHIMLAGITEDLEVGDEVGLDLIFRDAGTVSTTATVVEPSVVGEDPA